MNVTRTAAAAFTVELESEALKQAALRRLQGKV